MSATALSSEKTIQSIALVLAPVTFALSTFFWQNGEYNVYSGTLIILSMFFWIPAFLALFGILKDRTPRYATWGVWIAIFGCISGACFGFLGYVTNIFNISHTAYLEKLSQYPISSELLLFASGPLFPLSILVLGIVYLITKQMPFWIAISFCLAGIAFPLSRISRTEWIAHVADLLLLVPTIAVGFKINKR